ncbi:MAG TPA: ABC transporter substrate-binding protein, partial [Anaerolineales bacterium]|nr:ABC transporter substrate-binding protein [Anaerolineales bacterium]
LPPPENTPTPVVEAGPSLPTGPTALWIGWLFGPDNTNPFLAEWSESFNIFDLVYSTFYRLLPDGTYVPDLVESVSVSPDQRVWTFTIRKDVKFHDGQPLTAEDVEFSFNLFGGLDQVSALDETTVEIRLDDPVPDLEVHLQNYYVLPQHIWGRYENSLGAFDNLEMIGSGPFRMEAYGQDSFIHLKAVQDHYAFPPKIDDLIFITFPDEDMLMEALRTGDIQLIFTLPYFEVSTLADDPNIEIATGLPQFPGFDELVINLMAPENCPLSEEDYALDSPTDMEAQPCTGHPALRDRTVRLAMAHAVDKADLIDQLLDGKGDPGVSVLPIGLEDYFDPTLEDYAFDPTLSNQLLDEAGYLDSDGDGVREMPATSAEPGRPLSFRLDYPGPNAYYTQLVQQLAQSWQTIGITLTVRELDTETITFLCCPLFDYDLMLWGWGLSSDPGNIFDIFDTAQIPTGLNESGYSNPNYDILNAVQHTETDEKIRAALFWQMQRIIHDDLANLVLIYPQAVAAYRPDLFTGWITDAAHLSLEGFASLTQIEPAK